MTGKDFSVALILLLVMSLTFFLTPRFILLLQQGNGFFITKNFEGKKIVTAGGLIIFPIVLIPFFSYSYLEADHFFFLIFLTGITVLALVDDLFGERNNKGFRGHFKVLWKEKKISTGFLKALGGFSLAIFVAANVGDGNNIYWFVRAAVLALYANLFNLLDTRPALAIKFFYLFSFIFALFNPGGHIFLILLLWGSLYIYLPFELSRKIMLGDTGAYLLGGTLGFISISLFSPEILYIKLFFLLLLHLLLEKYSLSGFLDRVTKKE